MRQLCQKCMHVHADYPDLPNGGIGVGYQFHPHEMDMPCWCGAWHKTRDFPVMIEMKRASG